MHIQVFYNEHEENMRRCHNGNDEVIFVSRPWISKNNKHSIV